MIRDITIGQYYLGNSVIHRLDPRTKIIGTFLYMLSLFLLQEIWEYALAGFFVFLVIFLSKIPITYMIKGLKSVMVLIVFTFVFQVIFVTEGKVIFELGIFKLYSQGLASAGFLVMRIVLLIIGSSIMTYTTTPNQLTDGFESVLKPLKIFKIDVNEIAMMMTIALRYIPILLEETDKIMKAQMARGADFETGNLIARAKNMVPIIIPLFISAFRRASDLAMAMEARCYRGGKNRTKMKPLRYGIIDLVAYGILFAFFIRAFVGNFM